MLSLDVVRRRDDDFGTPPSTSAELISLIIDGQSIEVPEGTSVMRAAALAQIRIPKLCATDSLEAFGSCRLCLVEIEGRKGYPASCTTPAQAGMVVRTHTPALQKLRTNVMELYISDHPLDCLTCPANGDCELQDMAGVVGLRNVRYGFAGANHLSATKDESLLQLRPGQVHCMQPVCACLRRNSGHLCPDDLRARF
jgi:formate dehydrogenase major subunit